MFPGLSYPQTLKMKATICITSFLMGISLIAFGQQKNDLVKLINQPADIGLIYPISTNGAFAPYCNNKISIQAIAGFSGGIEGVAVAGIANIIRENCDGTAFAGIVNTVGHDAKGAQFAGIVNLVSGKTTGVQVAGILNYTGKGKVMQIGGIGNITSGEKNLVQIGGIFNRSEKTNTQIAGIINMAGKVSGIQFSGLINVADSSDYPIGLINLIKDGEKSIGISTDENLNTFISLYSGGRIMFGILGIGYNLKNIQHLFGLQGGIGAHLLKGGNFFRLDVEALQLVQTDFKNGHSFQYSLQALPEIKIGRSMALFGGPSVNLMLDYSDKKISGIVHHYPWTTTGPSGHFIGAYFGVTGGLKFIL